MGHDLSLDTQLISLSHNPLRAENSARTFFMQEGGGIHRLKNLYVICGGMWASRCCGVSADFVGVGVPDDPKDNTSSVICSANATFPKGKALRRADGHGLAPYEGMETERGTVPVAPNRRQKAAAS